MEMVFNYIKQNKIFKISKIQYKIYSSNNKAIKSAITPSDLLNASEIHREV